MEITVRARQDELPEALRRFAEEARDRWRAHYEDAMAEFASCPFCDWRSSSGLRNRWLSMLRHFMKAHRDITKDGTLVWAYHTARQRKAAA